jgi:VIT1/CCC1 family predicted Fe2+/Mn2+ transporter/rubrerythrin
MTSPGNALTKTEKNLWNAIVAEAVANVKYQAFAQQALIEGHPEVAQIFQEVAGAENIHGINHLRVAGDIQSTLENLHTVIAGEAEEAATLYPAMIKAALDDGRHDAADTFRVAMDREKNHIVNFTQALEGLEEKLASQPTLNADNAPTQPTATTSSAMPQSRTPQRTQPQSQTVPGRAMWAATEEVEFERWRIAAFSRIREVVFGAQDGLLSTVALVTAVAAAVTGDSTTFVLVAGLAAALAGMISMGTGTFLGARAQLDLQRSEIEKEAKELQEHPAEELAELVSLYQREGMSLREARDLAEHIASDKDLWLRTLVEKELGISMDTTSNPLKDALAMSCAFILAAMIPILPYFFLDRALAIPVSIGVALAGLFALGYGKGKLVQKSPIVQGFEILVIGSIAAGLAFLIGDVVPRLV